MVHLSVEKMDLRLWKGAHFMGSKHKSYRKCRFSVLHWSLKYKTSYKFRILLQVCTRVWPSFCARCYSKSALLLKVLYFGLCDPTPLPLHPRAYKALQRVTNKTLKTWASRKCELTILSVWENGRHSVASHRMLSIIALYLDPTLLMVHSVQRNPLTTLSEFDGEGWSYCDLNATQKRTSECFFRFDNPLRMSPQTRHGNLCPGLLICLSLYSSGASDRKLNGNMLSAWS